MAGGLIPNSLGVLSELLGGVLNGEMTLSLRLKDKSSVDVLVLPRRFGGIFGLPIRFTGGGALETFGLLLNCDAALDGSNESDVVPGTSNDALALSLTGEPRGEIDRPSSCGDRETANAASRGLRAFGGERGESTVTAGGDGRLVDRSTIENGLCSLPGDCRIRG